MNVDNEVSLLLAELERFGGRVKFGELCKDDKIVNTFEALGGTLKAAKKRKLIGFSPESELLLQGAHDHVEVFLIQPKQPAAEKQQPAAPSEPQPEESAAPAANAPAENSPAASAQQPSAASAAAADDQSAHQDTPSAAAASGNGNDT